MWSNGNSFGASAGNILTPGFGEDTRRTVPPWRFGLRLSDDRGGM